MRASNKYRAYLLMKVNQTKAVHAMAVEYDAKKARHYHARANRLRVYIICGR
jgi:hypothetical protein